MDFMLNLLFNTLMDLLKKSMFPSHHMSHGNLEDGHCSVGKSKFSMKSVFKSWFLGRIWLYHFIDIFKLQFYPSDTFNTRLWPDLMVLWQNAHFIALSRKLIKKWHFVVHVGLQKIYLDIDIFFFLSSLQRL